jgi:hypothetical protein
MKTHHMPPVLGHGAGYPGGGHNPLARGGMAGFTMIRKSFPMLGKNRAVIPMIGKIIFPIVG